MTPTNSFWLSSILPLLHNNSCELSMAVRKVRKKLKVIFGQILNGVLATFHRPHPQPVTDKGAVKSVRRFLANAGVLP